MSTHKHKQAESDMRKVCQKFYGLSNLDILVRDAQLAVTIAEDGENCLCFCVRDTCLIAASCASNSTGVLWYELGGSWGPALHEADMALEIRAQRLARLRDGGAIRSHRHA